MQVDDRLRDRESESRAAAHGAGCAPEPLEDAGHVLGANAGPVVVDFDEHLAVVGADPYEDSASTRCVPDRVVDQDDDQLAEAGVIATDHAGLRIDAERDAAIAGELREGSGAFGRHVAEVHRHPAQRDRAGIGASEEQQVVDERREVTDLGIDVVECLGRGLRLAAIAAEMLDGAPDDRQRRSQLMARVGGELALTAQGRPLRDERFADRHERPSRVDPAEAHRDEHDEAAAQEEHAEDRVERLLLRRAVLDDLDEDRADGRIDPLSHRPDRQRAHRRGADVGPVGDGGRERVTNRQAGGERVAADEVVAVRVDRHRERAAGVAAEREPVRGTARPAVRVPEVVDDLVRSIAELTDPVRFERLRRAPVQEHAEDGQDHEGRQAAPQDEPPADGPDQPAVRLLGIGVRGVGSHGRHAVTHRSVDTPRRGPSRSDRLRTRAWSGGSGRTRRRRWA
jgi:hypothetical protein